MALTSTHPSEADASCNAALRFKLLLVLLCTIHPRDTCVYVCVCEHTEAVGPTFWGTSSEGDSEFLQDHLLALVLNLDWDLNY